MANPFSWWCLDHGAPANGLPSDPGAPLREAPTAAMASILLDRGAGVKYTGALHAAVIGKDDADVLPLMSLLLDHGIDVNEVRYEGWIKLPRLYWTNDDDATALHIAAEEVSVERAKLLVERGADLGKKTKDGWTARDLAQLDRKENVKAYLEDVMRQRGMEFKEIDEKKLEEEYYADGRERYEDDFARRE